MDEEGSGDEGIDFNVFSEIFHIFEVFLRITTLTEELVQGNLHYEMQI